MITTEGEFLARIVDYEKVENVKKQFVYASQIYNNKVLMAKPLFFDIVNNRYVCTLFTWINGIELREIVGKYEGQQQYDWGIQAGKSLKILHSDQKNIENISWNDIYVKKVSKKLSSYYNCGDKYENDKILLDYVNNNIDLIKDRPMIIQHGDYHDGNLVVNEEMKIGIIDYNRIDLGDPWQEFDKTMWSLKYSIDFTRGLIDGYFDKNVPEKFFRLLALYSSVLQISNLPWAIKYNAKDQVNICKNQTKRLLSWYNNFNSIVPMWYEERR